MVIRRPEVIALLLRYQCKKFGVVDNHEVWIFEETSIIRIPIGDSIHLDLLEPILIDILGMGMWDYDLWLGTMRVN